MQEPCIQCRATYNLKIQYIAVTHAPITTLRLLRQMSCSITKDYSGLFLRITDYNQKDTHN